LKINPDWSLQARPHGPRPILDEFQTHPLEIFHSQPASRRSSQKIPQAR